MAFTDRLRLPEPGVDDQVTMLDAICEQIRVLCRRQHPGRTFTWIIRDEVFPDGSVAIATFYEHAGGAAFVGERLGAAYLSTAKAAITYHANDGKTFFCPLTDSSGLEQLLTTIQQNLLARA